MECDRLSQQMKFIAEIDNLKQVLRRTVTLGAARNENSAEHSWHIAVMAMVLAEYAEGNIDLCRTIKMMLVHDLVEIYAGDTYCYDEEAGKDKVEREAAAADRIFAMLPADQTAEFRSLWEEFEAGATAEARFASSLDRLQALLLNYHTRGVTWHKHGVRREQVIARAAPIEAGSRVLWKYARALIDDAVAQGLLKPKGGV
ncbi:MAG TPA: HD domain-containing protein [bacterium]|nr:HD domain-containing protein [bacterium]